MKRAKIMLLAIAVIATVGGALAFKAQRFTTQNVYCATIPAGGALTCTTVLVPFKTKIAAFPSFSTPCETWHNALGLGATKTSSYYTTTGVDGGGVACNIAPIRATVTTTDVE
jgi:hypothetical protein